jgi:hypothetical protein
MLIEVTQEHIDNGDRESNSRCPIALAMIDAGYNCPFVGNSGVNTFDHSRVDLPQVAVEFIQNLSSKRNVKPFSFELDLEAARVD